MRVIATWGNECSVFTTVRHSSSLQRVINALCARGAEIVELQFRTACEQEQTSFVLSTLGGGPNIPAQVERLVDVIEVEELDRSE